MRILPFLLAFTLSASANDNLPKSSADLLQKLSDWESQKQFELNVEITEKRESVLAILNRQLVETTKAGNLEGALAIQSEIQRLTPTPKSIPKKETKVFEPKNTSWKYYSAWHKGNIAARFKSSGELVLVDENGGTETKGWVQNKDGSLTVTWGNAMSQVWRFRDEYTKATITNGNDSIEAERETR